MTKPILRYTYERFLSDYLIDDCDPTSEYYDVLFWVDLIDPTNNQLIDSELVGSAIQLTNGDNLDWGSINWNHCDLTDETTDKLAWHDWQLVERY